jgi:hypothetical protein
MNNTFLILGIIVSAILILFGTVLIYYHSIIYVKTEGIIENAECSLDRNVKNFIYNCKIEFYHILNKKKYYNIKDVKTSIIPYRRYDKIDIYYNKNDPINVITDDYMDNAYLYVPLVLGIILLLIVITLYFMLI